MASPPSPDILNQPILPPPPGKVPNFLNPPSTAKAVYVAAGICLPLILLFAVLRYFAKFKILKRKTWDDFTCALGVLAEISFICLTVAAVAGGAYGSHSWDITIGEFTKEQLLLSVVVETIGGPCVWIIKLSLFVLYLEIFGLINWLRYSVYAGIVTTGVFYFASMIAFAVLCSPRDGQSQFSYLSALASPRCTQSRKVVLAQGIVSTISDLYIILLPLPAIWSLQMPLRRKFGVAAMVLTGLIAVIASVLGLAYRVELNRSTDNTWKVIPVWIATIVEMTAGVLVCCMPMTAAVFNRIRGPLKSFISSSIGGLLSTPRNKTAVTHERIESTSNLRPDLGESNYQAQVLSREKALPHWSDSANDSIDWPREPRNESAYPLEVIRKTTDIEIASKIKKDNRR